MRKAFTIEDLSHNIGKVNLKATPLEGLIFALKTNKYRKEIVDFEIDVHEGLTLEVGGKKFRVQEATKKELGEFIKLAHMCEGR